MTNHPNHPENSAAVTDFLRRCGCVPEALTSERLELLSRFRENLVRENTRNNLTRLLEPHDFWIKHVADCLAVGLFKPEILQQPMKLADIGCGAGFPLFPLAWANPGLSLTGIDSDAKRLEFVAGQALELGLANISTLARQAREAARLPEHQGMYDIVTARAVTRASVLIRDCRQLLAPTGCMILYKTPESVAAELSEAEREARKFKLEIAESATFELPENSGQRQFLLVGRGHITTPLPV